MGQINSSPLHEAAKSNDFFAAAAHLADVNASCGQVREGGAGTLPGMRIW